MSLIFKSIVCLIGAVALFTGCSKEHGVLSADDASLRTPLAVLKGFGSVVDGEGLAKSAVNPVDLLSDVKNPKVCIAWLGETENGDTAVFSPLAFSKEWPLKFSAEIMSLPNSSLSWCPYPDFPNSKICMGLIALFDDKDSNGVLEYKKEHPLAKDFLFGMAKYNYILYCTDQKAVSWIDSVTNFHDSKYAQYFPDDTTISNKHSMRNVKPGLNLMKAQQVRECIDCIDKDAHGNNRILFNGSNRVEWDNEVDVQIFNQMSEFRGCNF